MITDFPQKSYLEGLLRLAKMSPGLDKFIRKTIPPINLFIEKGALRRGWYKILKFLLCQFRAMRFQEFEGFTSCESAAEICCCHSIHQRCKHGNDPSAMLCESFRSAVYFKHRSAYKAYLKLIAEKHTKATNIKDERVIIKFTLASVQRLILPAMP